MRRIHLAFAVLALLSAAMPVRAQGVATQLQPAPDPAPITGQPRIVNTSSLNLEGKRIVLFGVDPMMKGNPCSVDNRAWDCGTAALRTLMNMLGREPVTCEPKLIDLFKRVYAKCFVNGQDIAQSLVEAGMAVTVPEETTEYDAVQQEASKKKAGVWRGRFMSPSDYRAMISDEPLPR